jgi:hypothetical protein
LSFGSKYREHQVSVLARDIQNSLNSHPFGSLQLAGLVSGELVEPPWLGARVPLSVRQRQDRGRCLISLADIPEGATIEIAPVQVIPPEIVPLINAIRGNFITWRRPHFPETLAMPLGLLGLLSWTPKMRQVAKVEPCP